MIPCTINDLCQRCLSKSDTRMSHRLTFGVADLIPNHKRNSERFSKRFALQGKQRTQIWTLTGKNILEKQQQSNWSGATSDLSNAS